MSALEHILIVATDGSERFRTVQAAIDSVPAGNSQRVIIQIRPGIYADPVRVPRDKGAITLRGGDAATTVLTGKLTARMLDEQGAELGTFRTATVFIDGEDFVAENIAFENTAGEGGQALAASVSGDRAIFRGCRFLGWQDTLYLTGGRSYSRDCYIEGHCDYIFGDGTAVFDACEVHSRSANYITAASTPEDREFGFVFLRCRLTDDGGSRAYYLGRPWRPHAATTFIDCELGGNVSPLGWHNWKKPEAEATVRYFEHNNRGEGARPAHRVSWARQLSDDEAAGFTPTNILRGGDGWDPTA